MPEKIPGYGAAVAREKFIRAASFVAANEYICGVPVLPLNIWHVMALDTIGSPFVTKSERLTATDIHNFLWIVSPGYTTSKLDRRWFWVARLRNLPAGETIRGIVDYLTEAYSDGPGSEPGSGISYYSAAAGLVDCMAREYGWSEAEIIRLPLKRAFQYSKAINQRLSAKAGIRAVLFNPSDGVRQQFIDAQNKN